jgi:hypothetical protein
MPVEATMNEKTPNHKVSEMSCSYRIDLMAQPEKISTQSFEQGE